METFIGILFILFIIYILGYILTPFIVFSLEVLISLLYVIRFVVITVANLLYFNDKKETTNQ